jgi:hypothetical protein
MSGDPRPRARSSLLHKPGREQMMTAIGVSEASNNTVYAAIELNNKS